MRKKSSLSFCCLHCSPSLFISFPPFQLLCLLSSLCSLVGCDGALVDNHSLLCLFRPFRSLSFSSSPLFLHLFFSYLVVMSVTSADLLLLAMVCVIVSSILIAWPKDLLPLIQILTLQFLLMVFIFQNMLVSPPLIRFFFCMGALDSVWECYDCRAGSRPCFICHRVGPVLGTPAAASAPPDSVVVQCKGGTCGRFYHLACVRSHRLTQYFPKRERSQTRHFQMSTPYLCSLYCGW